MSGYYTIADLLATWLSSVDSLYSDPIVQAGDGGGLEAYDQAFAQYERVSQAIDRTMQAMYILPHSSQTNLPAAGESYAVVGLSFERSTAFHVPIILQQGMLVEELASDHGADAGVIVRTGRRYGLVTSVVFYPGEVGPKLSTGKAEAPGYSYNNPEPDSIRAFVQESENSAAAASVISNGVTDVLYSAPDVVTFTPNMIGQYVTFLAGPNLGKLRRILSYGLPSTTPVENSGSVTLAHDILLTVGAGVGFITNEVVTDSVTLARGTLLYYDTTTGNCLVQVSSGYFAAGGNLVGDSSAVASAISVISTVGMLTALYIGGPISWIVGETLNQAATGASGTYLYADNTWAILNLTAGNFSAGFAVLGVSSAVTHTPTVIGVDASLLAENRTAEWRVLSWEWDLGFSVTNALSPTGGQIGMLDELGRERRINRADGEDDATYRIRVGSLPDTIAPNAIRRACAKVFTPHGWTYEFREVGTGGLSTTTPFEGFFYDVPTTYAPMFSFAWDMDFSVRPVDRFKVWLDYTEFRAFFMIGVPATGLGEFGFGYDSHPLGFYDIPPYLDFYDGYPVGEGAMNIGLYNDLIERKAGGVGFDFYQK